MQIETATWVSAFFDGSSPSSGDYFNQWVGSVNNSPSMRLGVTVSGLGISGQVTPIASRTWVDRGVVSLAAVRTRADGDAYLQMFLNIDPSNKTYTYKLTTYVPTPTVMAGGITVGNNAYTTIATVVPSGSTLNGLQTWSVQAVFGSSQGSGIRLVFRGGTDGVPIYYDSLSFVEGVNALPNYRDGNSPGWFWDGTEFNSASRGFR
jgi:hypothetical protein